ncbi:MAG: tripartite tricarboxylate transporter substrate-binding protein [Beijerinckiaceae bacterium]|nr:tripartite tricarboxylate transporter substrate-binding protein [Beijerinckiaceae bacterium]
MTRRNFLAISFGAALGVLGAAASAHAQTNEADFFKGKTIRMIVGFSPGGGYDVYARMIAPYIAQRLGGTVVVENMPGAGSMAAMNNVFAAEPDGLRMMLAHGTASGLAQITDAPTVRFQLSNFSHLGTVGSNPYIWLVHNDAAEKTPADFVKSGRTINWAASGPLDGMSDGAQITCAGIKLTCKVVMGYKGSNDAALAVTRKEMDAVFVNDTSANNYVRSNDLRAVANMSRQRSEFFKNVPTVFEAVKLTSEEEWLFDFHSTLHALGRILIAPPNMAPARLNFIRGAVKDALTDPKLIAEGEKSQRQVNFTDAEKTIEAVRRVINDLTPAQKKKIQALLSAK